MKAMIFAAGMGTRLRPLTDNKPKALVEISGKPLIYWIIRRLENAGFTDIVVNVHHFANQIEEYLSKNEFDKIRFQVSDERDILLDTGGGLKKAEPFLAGSEPVLVHNVDIISPINLNLIYQKHKESGALATLAVSNRLSTRGFLFNTSMQLCGWKNLSTQQTRISRPNEELLDPLAFSGIHVISPQIFELMHEEGIFSIVDVYLRLASSYEILGFDHSGISCIDLGKIENIKQVEAEGIL